MALFGRKRDFEFIKLINDQYVKKIGEHKVAYIKISLTETETPNIYGESMNKVYNNPILIECLINSSPQSPSVQVGLPSVNKNVTFSFFREHLKEINLYPEKGDIIMWNEDYYEVYNLIENNFLYGKNGEYSLTETTKDFGGSISIQLETIYINPEKLPFKIERI